MNMDAFFTNNFPAIVAVAVAVVVVAAGGVGVDVRTVYAVFHIVAQCDWLQLLLVFTRVHVICICFSHPVLIVPKL